MDAEKSIALVVCMVYVYIRQVQMKSFFEFMKMKFIRDVCFMYNFVMHVSAIRQITLTMLLKIKRKRSRLLTGDFYIRPRSIHWFSRHFGLMDDIHFRRLFRFPRDLFQKLVEIYGGDLVFGEESPVGIQKTPKSSSST